MTGKLFETGNHGWMARRSQSCKDLGGDILQREEHMQRPWDGNGLGIYEATEVEDREWWELAGAETGAMSVARSEWVLECLQKE